MRIDIYDGKPIEKTITRYMYQNNKKIENCNVKDVEEAILNLIKEIWLVVIYFLSDIFTEPDSKEFPGLTLAKPEVSDSYKETILQPQRDFNKKKTKTSKSLSKVNVRYGRLIIGAKDLNLESILKVIQHILHAFVICTNCRSNQDIYFLKVGVLYE